MPTPRKHDRNAEMVELRLKDPKTWTYEALGHKYGISKVSAWEIVRRDLDELSTA